LTPICFPSRASSRSRTGFSLLEVLVVLMIMGLATQGLLQLLHWGHLRYRTLSDGWQERAILTSCRTTLRRELARPGPHPGDEEIRRILDIRAPWAVAELSVKQYAQGAVFVRIVLYRDRNGNGRPDPAEQTSPLFVCFQRRSEPT
jgi:prepilin-type N-terminal cleavage/methylation domain-containing protein